MKKAHGLCDRARAVDAVNLDGGGSTTMTIGNQLVNRPSDTTGERPIADAIIIQP